MKYICITWAASGIGQALSLFYKQENIFSLILTVRTEQQKQELSLLFPLTDIYVVDFSSYSETQIFWEYVAYRELELIIFCAGTWVYRYFHEQNPQEIQAQFQVNTLAPLLITHMYIQKHMNQCETKFVYLSSLVADLNTKHMSVYSASKKALNQSLSLLQYESPHLKILNLHLWAIQTPMHQKSGMKKTHGKKLEAVIPRIISKIDTRQWKSYVFFDWWCIAHILWPLQPLSISLTTLWKKY